MIFVVVDFEMIYVIEIVLFMLVVLFVCEVSIMFLLIWLCFFLLIVGGIFYFFKFLISGMFVIIGVEEVVVIRLVLIC